MPQPIIGKEFFSQPWWKFLLSLKIKAKDYFWLNYTLYRGLPGDTGGKKTVNEEDIRDVGSIPGLGRTSRGRHGNALENHHGQRSLVGYSP